MSFEQELLYESGTVRLTDGTLFLPLKTSTARWIWTRLAPYHLLTGYNATVLYQLSKSEYVLIEYSCCRLVPHGPNHDMLWVSDSPPTGHRISPQRAVKFFLDSQLELPEELHEIATQPPERPAPRPLEIWADSDLLELRTGIGSHTVDPIKQAEQIQFMAVRFIQSNQDHQTSDEGLCDGSDGFFEALLFRVYRVDTRLWLEANQGIPPEYLGLLDLEWPEGSESIREVLRRIRSLLKLPFAVFASSRLAIGHPQVPTSEELQLAVEQFWSVFPKVTAATEDLIQALAKYKESLVEQEQELEYKHVFQLQSDKMWSVRFDGVSAQVPALLGMGYIRELLSRPKRLIEAMELEAIGKFRAQIEQGTTGKILDQQARDEIQAEYDLFTEQLAEAEKSGNSEQAALLQERILALALCFSEATGLFGSSREDGNVKELARKRVSKAITESIKEIHNEHRSLAVHLKKCIRTGATLIYEHDERMDWVT